MAGKLFKMADLKRSKESLSTKTAGKVSPDPYSYEHRITLDANHLDSLGIDVPKVGDTYHVLGHAEVKSVSQNDHGAGDKSTRVELQFKRMGMKPKVKGGGGLLAAVNSGIKQAESD